MSRKKKEPPPKRSSAGRHSPPPIPPEPDDAKMVGVWFPVAYLKVIGAEAAKFGVGRGQFLSMLVKRRAGDIIIQRPPNATKQEADAVDLVKTQKYVWAMMPEDRNRVDAARLAMGNITLGNYLMHLVNEWLGQPDGLIVRVEFDETPTDTSGRD